MLRDIEQAKSKAMPESLFKAILADDVHSANACLQSLNIKTCVDAKGNGPLHIACYIGSGKVATLMLESGMDPLAVNSFGLNAFQILYQNDYEDLAQVFRTAHPEVPQPQENAEEKSTIQLGIQNYYLACDLQKNHNPKVAVDLFQSSIKFLKLGYGRENHPGIGSVIGQLGISLLELGQYQEAKAQFSKALAIFSEAYLGYPHKDTAMVLHQLGIVEFLLGSFNAAKDCFERALQMQTIAYGSSKNKSSAMTKHQMGILLEVTGDLAGALNCFEEAIAIERSSGESESQIDILRSRCQIGSIYLAQGKFEDAAALYNQILKALNDTDVACTIEKSKVLHQIGLLMHTQERLEEALFFYFQSLELKQQLYQEFLHKDIAKTTYQIGLVYFSQNKYDEAERYLLRTISIEEANKSKGIYELDIVKTMLALGKLAIACKQSQKAKKWLEAVSNFQAGKSTETLCQLKDEAVQLIADVTQEV